MKRKSRYLGDKPLEEQFPGDQATVEWLKAQKKSTQHTYRYGWKFFLEYTGMTGDEILAERKLDTEYRWEKKILTFKQWLIEQGKSSNTATTIAAVARGFFGFHRKDLKFRRTESMRLSESERKYEDYHFSREDLKKMCDFGDLTEKYVVIAGKSFGFRAGDFLRLTRGDLEPYLDREVPISIGEMGTTKEKVKAYPFIDADALPIIKLKIEEMNRIGRTKPTDKMLVYKQERQLSRIIKRLAKKAGIDFGNKQIRFHCLRKFLADRLSAYMSESKWKQVIGKKISEKAYVSPDELRKDYARAMADICWTGVTDQTDVEKRVKVEMLRLKAKELGLTEEEIQIKLTKMELDEFNEWLRERKRSQQSQVTELNGGNCQKIVFEEELDDYLGRGWKVAAVLPSGKVVVGNEK